MNEVVGAGERRASPLYSESMTATAAGELKPKYEELRRGLFEAVLLENGVESGRVE
jgi:hypothetical protein